MSFSHEEFGKGNAVDDEIRVAEKGWRVYSGVLAPFVADEVDSG
jgi:hypothetical protein